MDAITSMAEKYQADIDALDTEVYLLQRRVGIMLNALLTAQSLLVTGEEPTRDEMQLVREAIALGRQ